MVRRKATIAWTSCGVKLAKAWYGMIGASMRPSGRAPVWMAATTWAPVQLPSPGSLSDCRVGTEDGPEPRHSGPDVGAAKVAGHIGLAEEVARRVAVMAARDGDEIFAPR